MVASESAALDICGASYVREVEPGEMIAIDENGIRTSRFAEAKPKGCVFEYVYLARPDTDIAGRNVYLSRVEMGRPPRLKEAPVEADLVIATPESGTPAAIGYAEASGIPFGAGLVKNAYVGRTFIQPSQTIRQLGIRLKLNPLKEVIKGKKLVVVDDSIVRGNTQRALVRMLRQGRCGRGPHPDSSPPVKWPCFFGIDFATRAELIANGMSVDEIGKSLGADSLSYISLEGMIEATTIQKPNLCRACFDGEYPMELQDPSCSASSSWRPSWPPARPPPRLPTPSVARKTPLQPPQYDTKFPAMPETTGASYASAGVDIEAGDRAVELMKEWVKKTQRPEVLGGLGGFAGLFDASALKRYERPLLASATDGVGTKVDIARQMGVYDTIGHDLVAMVMDDIVVCGAEPLFMTDYICVGKVDRAGRRHRQGHRRGMRPRRLRPGRRRDGGAPGPPRPGRLRRRRRGHGCRGARPAARRGPHPYGGRGHRHGVLGPSLQRVLARPARGLRPRRHDPRPAGRGARPDARRGAPGAHEDLLAGLPGPSPGPRTSTPSATSREAVSPPTWRG
ncbi:Amidophosphoribosyltransferase [Streptomyces tanashiensis]